MPNHFFLAHFPLERNEHILDFEHILCAKNYFKCFTCVKLEFNLCLQKTVNNSLIRHLQNNSLNLWIEIITFYIRIFPQENDI